MIYLDTLAAASTQFDPAAALTQQISLSSTRPFLRHSRTDATSTVATAAVSADIGVRDEARVNQGYDRLE